MHHGLDAAFQQLALVDEPIYFGDLNVKHRRDAVFYVVIRGFVPGVYDTWAEAGPQVTGYSGNIHNKCRGWKAALCCLRHSPVDDNDSLNFSTFLLDALNTLDCTPHGYTSAGKRTLDLA
ncbi:hypothetical protein FB45DRAFT_1021775 [Roridomyces roridus]|uniref:Ribonuclease H1 N-terminal domain-containing protein n=1 Tax=Roridomyces roridus TaxID=1738132 RepID=A0AAD7C8T0_9AGAR|nr:hypothetical protein FB45DRAFT_1021775 [Roridomyces roridus]